MKTKKLYVEASLTHASPNNY